MQNKVLTLKQLADKLEVSKSYIDKTIRTLGMHTELKKMVIDMLLIQVNKGR